MSNVFKKRFMFLRNFTMSSLMEFFNLLEQLGVEVLTLFRNVNQESVEIV